MAFDGNEGTFVPLADTKRWTKNYRDANPGLDTTRAHFYGRDKLQQLLDQSGSAGIRIYHGINDEGKQVLVLLAAKQDENNILPSNENEVVANDSGLVLEVAWPCPPYCPPDNGL